ncbi:pirin family protein [Actinorhabdospora filicis]|nr:pirin family protein [Actinorhabdospora filicis]
MSNLDHNPTETTCAATPSTTPTTELIPGHEVALGGIRDTTTVHRTLPSRTRRMIGAFCFIDHYGPHPAHTHPMNVPPHPHTGLQTVSWLISGHVQHRDSTGRHQTFTNGELGLMTAGHGITHSENTTPDTPPTLHGFQLWIALPDHARNTTPHFEHHPHLPTDGTTTVILGTHNGTTSPATTHTPLLFLQIQLPPNTTHTIPLNPHHEHGALTATGNPTIDNTPLPPGPLLYLGTNRTTLTITTHDQPTTLLILGGEPFQEEIVMWWNLIARDHDEIVTARQAWENHDPRFGTVTGYTGKGTRLDAPPMPTTRLKPRGRTR